MIRCGGDGEPIGCKPLWMAIGLRFLMRGPTPTPTLTTAAPPTSSPTVMETVPEFVALGVTVNVTGPGPACDAGDTVAIDVPELDAVKVVPPFVSVAVKVCAGPPTANDRVTGVTVIPPAVTDASRVDDPPWSSVTTTLALPRATAVMVKVIGPGPEPEAGATVTTDVFEDAALIVPVYVVSVAVKVSVLPMVLIVDEALLSDSDPKGPTVTLSAAVCVWSSFTSIEHVPLPTGVTVNVPPLGLLAGLTVAMPEHALATAVREPVYADSLAVNVLAEPAPTSVKVSDAGASTMGPKVATVALTEAVWVWSSSTAIVQVPLATGVTVNVVLLVPLVGVAVATLDGQALKSRVKAPV